LQNDGKNTTSASMAQSDDTYLHELREHAAETRLLLSNPLKPERERMVVRAFLRCLGVAFADNGIVASTEEPVDVHFRAARFQIMEIVGDRRRGKEWAEREQLYLAAETVADVMTPFRESTAIPFDEAAWMVAEALEQKCRRYGPPTCATLDALVYIDLRNSHLSLTEPSGTLDVAAELSRQGWRSASMLSIPYSIVLNTNADAPDFLRSKVGLPLSAWPGPNGWFEQ
jgi:hypothetical protein